jgi:hypothetical protein
VPIRPESGAALREWADAERIAAHEAGHACACVVLGVPVRLVDVSGDATAYGRVRHGLEEIKSRADARKRVLIILCGLIEGAEDWDELPAWPLETHRSTDEYNLHALADYLGLDKAGYSALEMEALKLTLDPFYRVLHVAVTGCSTTSPASGRT